MGLRTHIRSILTYANLTLCAYERLGGGLQWAESQVGAAALCVTGYDATTSATSNCSAQPTTVVAIGPNQWAAATPPAIPLLFSLAVVRLMAKRA